MTNDLQQKRDEVTYIKDVKELILSDARALYSMQGLISRKASFDIMTSYYQGGHQATIIFYPDVTENKIWSPLLESPRCTTMCAAVKHLWSAVQESLGAMIAAQRCALMSPTSTLATDATATTTSNAFSSIEPLSDASALKSAPQLLEAKDEE